MKTYCLHTSFNIRWISFFVSSQAFWSSSSWLWGWVWLWVWLCDWRSFSWSLGLFLGFSILKTFRFRFAIEIILTYISARDRNILSNQLAIMPDFDKLYPMNIYIFDESLSECIFLKNIHYKMGCVENGGRLYTAPVGPNIKKCTPFLIHIIIYALLAKCNNKNVRGGFICLMGCKCLLVWKHGKK